MSITVVNKYRITPAKTDIYVGRGSPLGNPFIIGTHGTREEVIDKYKVHLAKATKLYQADVCNALNNIMSRHLKGEPVRLVCYCKPQACHGDVIKDMILKFIDNSSR